MREEGRREKRRGGKKEKQEQERERERVTWVSVDQLL